MIQAYFKNNKYIHLAFILAFFIMTLAFANEKVFPFGDRQIMVIDSWHQYYPFLNELHSKLINGESLLYSWNTGGGSNFVLIMAYLLTSPLYLLSVLFPKEYLREFMLLATVVKIGLAGAFFAVYIRGVFKRNDFSITLAGVLYALCGYAMGYYWNIMWLDPMALFPLIMLGLNRLIDEDKYLLYTVSLAVTIISSFFISYFICEFIAIYFFILYYIRHGKQGWRHLGDKLGTMAISSALALGMAAVVLLPTYHGLMLTFARSYGGPKSLEVYFSLMDIFNNLLANVSPSVKEGLPNIYCGFIAILMGIYYFASRSIPVRSKLLNGLLLIFLVFSFNINYLNYIWHGFKFPNEVPYRFAFVFSFLVLSLAYQGYMQLQELSTRTVWQVAGVFSVYLLMCEKLYTNTFDYKVFYVSLLLLFLYSGALLLYKNESIKKTVFVGFMCYVILGEALLSALNGVDTTGTSARNGYPAKGEAVRAAIEQLYQDDPTFYRLDMLKWYSTNDPALYGYRGVSQFSSTANAQVSTLLRALGIPAGADANRYTYASSTPLVNGLLSLKYLMGRDQDGRLPNAAYEKLSSDGGVEVYRSKFTLPAGFMVNETIEVWDTASKNPFEVQENFIKQATGQAVRVFRDVPVEAESFNNIEITEREGIRHAYRNKDSSRVGRAELTFKAPESGQMYLYVYANRSYKTKVTLDGKAKDYETRRGMIIDLGVREPGDTIDVGFEVFAEKDGYYYMQAVTFDESAYQGVHKKLADEPFKVKEFTATTVKGTVHAKASGLLYTSIPYEKGWTVKVDGQKTGIRPLKEAFITVPISPGTHTVEMSYAPEGFYQGALVSIVSAAILAAFCLMDRRREKGTPIAPPVPEPEPSGDPIE